MLKEQFTLKKNSWYMKLMNYIWGFTHRDFTHMCPFFWLTILNLIIIVPFFLLKILFKAIVYPFSKISNYLDNLQNKREDEINEMIKTTANTNKDFKYVLGLCKRKRERALYYMKYHGFYTEAHLIEDKIRDKWKETIIAQEQKEIFRKEYIRSNKQKINNILKYFKPFISILTWLTVTAFSLFVLYGIYWIILQCTHASARVWTTVGTVLGFFALVIGFLYLLFLYINYKYKNSCRKDGPGFWTKLFTKIAIPFMWLVDGIWNIGSIIIEIAKNNCPAIEWKDKE